MRYLITISNAAVAILLAATLCASQSSNSNGAAKSEAKPNSHIKTKYNQSKNETTVTLKTLALSNSMNREFTRESEFGNPDLDVSFTIRASSHPKLSKTRPSNLKAPRKTSSGRNRQSGCGDR